MCIKEAVFVILRESKHNLEYCKSALLWTKIILLIINSFYF